MEEKDVEQIRDIIAKYYALSNYNTQHELTGEGDDERITKSLYPLLDCLVSEENKSWLDGGLNYTLDKIVNQDPEMFEIANQYRSELERKNENETINWQYVYNDNLKQWRINPETGEPHPDDLAEYYKDQAEKQSISDNLEGKLGIIFLPLKGLACGEDVIVRCIKEYKTVSNPLRNVKYTDKVKTQATWNDNHGFPEEVDAFGGVGKVEQIKGGDGIMRTKIEIEGEYKGENGIFEYIIEPDGITCNHRLFVVKE